MTTRATPDDPPSLDSEEWVTRPEAAAMLRVSLATIDRYGRTGAMNRFRTPGGGTRFLRSEVERLIRREQKAS